MLAQTQWAKAVCLFQVEGHTTDPMDFMSLLILPRLYRRWAGLRLRDIAPWVRSWQLQEMYAGVPGGGAELAWLHAGITRESAFQNSRGTLAGALDIFKCFDQIAPF